MAVFVYDAKFGNGDAVRDKIEAPNRMAALAELRRRDFTVLSLEEASVAGQKKEKAKARVAPDRKNFVKEEKIKKPKSKISGARLKEQDKAVFCRQLAIAVQSGMPLRDALQCIGEDQENAGFKKVIADVVEKMQTGESMTNCLKAYEKLFGSLFVSLMRVAEESGQMGPTLAHLAMYLEKAEKMRKEIKSQMAYPGFMAGFFVVALIGLNFGVLPKFGAMLSDLGSELPKMSKLVFASNDWVLRNSPYIGAVLLLAFGIFSVIVATPGGRMGFDRFKLKVPLLGKCLHQTAVARFTANIAIMLRSGVPIVVAMDISRDLCGNVVLKKALTDSRERLLIGYGISDALRESGLMPNLLLRMITIGESSGQLPEVLEKVAEIYEDEVESTIKAATSLIEPMLIVLFAVVVLMVVLAVYLPIFTMSNQVH